MFSEEKLSQAGQKKYWYKIFLLKQNLRWFFTLYTVVHFWATFLPPRTMRT